MTASESHDRLRVLLLFGGRSAEHDVSRVSAVKVAAALDPARYEVLPVAITREGRWLVASAARDAIAVGAHAELEAFEVEGDLVPVDAGGLAPSLGAALDCDVVFPILHGPYGEDGTVQGLCELAGLPYVGSGVIGSAAAMDKVTAKRLFGSFMLPQARAQLFRDGGDRADFAAAVATELGFPCFVKPSNMGSSVGVSKVRDVAGLDAAIDVALAYDEWIIVEEAITGREIEVAVLGDPPAASVAGEIAAADDFYSYADKYENGAAQLLVPAPLTAEQSKTVRGMALAAFEACRCEGLARVDFFLEETAADGGEGRGFLINEVNTMPGFTPISMFPRLWAESGVPYSELLDRLIDLAIARHARRAERAGRAR
jgi:D-alanine--D-alanine ligase